MFTWFLQNSPLLYLTQSLWRDEAFSILIAQKPILFLLTQLDFEPPFYYLLLHFWIKIFGASEIAVRSLSLTGFFFSAIIAILWAEKLFPKNWLRWFLPLTYITNPMLLYYAFEVRTYGWYTFFAILSLYSYSLNYWRIFTIATILGFYTHTYFIFIPLTQLIHWCFWNQHLLKSPRHLMTLPFVRSGLISFIFIIPWLLKIIFLAGKLKSSWYFPVDLNLIKSVLGNLFIGYEGTPGYLWPYTGWLSLLLCLAFIIALIPKNHRRLVSHLTLQVFLPLTLIIGTSFIKPLFVNRYVIPVTIAEVFLISFFLNHLKKVYLRAIFSLLIFSSSILFNFWYPAKHSKVNIRTTVNTVNALLLPRDVIYVTSPLVYFETKYYSTRPDRVFLYTPQGGDFPWYVGDAAFDTKSIRTNLPVYPARAFLINEGGEFEINYEQI